MSRAIGIGDVVEILDSGILGDVVEVRVSLNDETRMMVEYVDGAGTPVANLWRESSLRLVDDDDGEPKEGEPPGNVIPFPLAKVSKPIVMTWEMNVPAAGSPWKH